MVRVQDLAGVFEENFTIASDPNVLDHLKLNVFFAKLILQRLGKRVCDFSVPSSPTVLD